MDASDDITPNIPQVGTEKKLTIKTLKSPPVLKVDSCNKLSSDQEKLASDSDNWAFDDPDDYSLNKVSSNQMSVIRTTPRNDEQFANKLANPPAAPGLFDIQGQDDDAQF